MSIDPSRLWRQVALGEDTELELKAVEFRGGRVSAPRRDALADELAAFGNAGGGRLVLGVTDDREAQALDPAQLDAVTSLVTEICMDAVKPPLEYRVFRVPAPEPARGGALVVELPEGVTVHRSPGGCFRRRGDTRRQMDSAEIRRLSLARGQSDAASTDTQVVRGAGLNSLQPKLWRRYARLRVAETAEVALTKLKFVKPDLHRRCASADGSTDRKKLICLINLHAISGTRTRCSAERRSPPPVGHATLVSTTPVIQRARQA